MRMKKGTVAEREREREGSVNENRLFFWQHDRVLRIFSVGLQYIDRLQSGRNGEKI